MNWSTKAPRCYKYMEFLVISTKQKQHVQIAVQNWSTKAPRCYRYMEFLVISTKQKQHVQTAVQKLLISQKSFGKLITRFDWLILSRLTSLED